MGHAPLSSSGIAPLKPKEGLSGPPRHQIFRKMPLRYNIHIASQQIST